MMLRRLCILLMAALLAFGQPLHVAVADEGVSAAGRGPAHHCMSSSDNRHHCKNDFGAAVCQTLCNSVAALPAQDLPHKLPPPYPVEFFANGAPNSQSADIPPEPFPPRTSSRS